jgi:hypothetical protein
LAATFIASGETKLDFVGSVLQIVVCSVPIAFLGAWVARSSQGMRGLVGPWQADPWPVGVQEEDPDAPWGHEPDSQESGFDAADAMSPGIVDLPANAAAEAKPTVARLHGSVHRPH